MMFFCVTFECFRALYILSSQISFDMLQYMRSTMYIYGTIMKKDKLS